MAHTIYSKAGADSAIAAAVAAIPAGGGAVDSVNGQTGAVVLDASDVGADAAGTAAGLVAAHAAAVDPHPDYATAAEAAAVAPVQSVAGRTGAVTLAVADVSGAVATTDARLSDARTPLAHTHAIADTTGLQSALDGKAATGHTHAELHTHANAAALALVSGTNTGDEPDATTTAAGIVELATTAEATTGTDTSRAVTPAGLKAVADTKLNTSTAPELIRDTMGAALVAGANVIITPNDVGDTITIAAASGGGGDPIWNSTPSPVGSPLQIMAYGDFTGFGYGGTSSLSYYHPTPVFCEVDCQIDAASLYVSTAAAGGTIAAALYDWYSPNSMTLTKVADLGVFDTSSTGLKEITLAAPIALARGRYLVVSHANGTSPAVYGVTVPTTAGFRSVSTGNQVKNVWAAVQNGPPWNLLTAPTINMTERAALAAPNINLRRSA